MRFQFSLARLLYLTTASGIMLGLVVSTPNSSLPFEMATLTMLVGAGVAAIEVDRLIVRLRR
jgi:hypothetical protein